MWMLEGEPDKRPTAGEALMHEWFKCDKDILKQLLRANDIICSMAADNRSNYSKSV